MTFILGSPAACARNHSVVPSIEPSSTTSSSQSVNVCARMLATARGRVASALKAGSKTLMRGKGTTEVKRSEAQVSNLRVQHLAALRRLDTCAPNNYAAWA